MAWKPVRRQAINLNTVDLLCSVTWIKTNICMKENVIEYIVYKILATLCRPQCFLSAGDLLPYKAKELSYKRFIYLHVLRLRVFLCICIEI